jgi:hypothetical protein
MKTIRFLTTTLIMLFAVQSMAVAQSKDMTESFKLHFNETVNQVHQTDNADEKRKILNESFTKMIIAIDRIESRANLTDEQRTFLSSYRMNIADKQNELNGLDGFDEVLDDDLDDFSNFSQDSLEQANRTVTIGLTSALLILIILILLL